MTTTGVLRIPSNRNLLTLFERLESWRVPLYVWIFVIWALFVFPAIGLRAFHYEEGYVVAIARSAMEDSIWLDPHLYGWRFNERPHLMAWIVALLGMTFGTINHWVTRIPTVLSLLGSCFLIFWLVRRYASELAALFAVGCLMVSPMMLQKVITAEPDIMLSFILFGTFIVWWNGVERNRLTIARWLAIGGLLAAAALLKGPQPTAFFGIGAGAYHLLHRQWLNLAGMLLAGVVMAVMAGAWYWHVYQPGDLDVWLFHSKLGSGYAMPFADRALRGLRLLITLTLEHLPAIIILIPFGVVLLREPAARQSDLAIALMLYGLSCSLILVLWAGANSRYAMPGTLALAAAAGLAFERFRHSRPWLINVTLLLGAMFLIYRVVLGWLIMPAVPTLFQASQNAALTVSSTVSAQPAPLYFMAEKFQKNVAAYLHIPFRVMTSQAIMQVKPPAWVVVDTELEQKLRQARPDLEITRRGGYKIDVHDYHLLELRQK